MRRLAYDMRNIAPGTVVYWSGWTHEAWVGTRLEVLVLGTLLRLRDLAAASWAHWEFEQGLIHEGDRCHMPRWLGWPHTRAYRPTMRYRGPGGETLTELQWQRFAGILGLR